MDNGKSEIISEVTKIRLGQLYPDFRVKMIRIYNDVFRLTGMKMNMTEALRSFEKQKALYEHGRELRNGLWVKVGDILTNAPPGMSRHAYGLACDSAFAGKDPYLITLPREKRDWIWSEFGRVCRAYNCDWGGDWNGNGLHDPNDFDRPHCETTYGLKLTELLGLYNHGGLQAVWAEIDRIRQVPIGQGWKNPELTPA